MLTLCLALAAPVEPTPVPADALAVVQLRGASHFREQLAGLGAAVAPERAAGFAAQLDELLKRLPAAVDPTRRGYAAVLPDAAGVTWAAWLPTADPARTRAAVQPLDPSLTLFDRPGYLVVTPAKQLADAKPLTLATVGGAADLFAGSDVGAWVNLPAVWARYGGLLTGTRFTLPAMLRSGAFGLPKLDARQSAQIAAVVGGVIQVVADGTGLVVGVKVGPAGVTVEAALSVRPGTDTAAVLAGELPQKLPLLDALPGGQSAYAAGRFGVDLAKRFRTTFPEVSPSDPLAGWAAHGWATAGLAPGPVLELAHPERPTAWLDSVRAAYRRAAVVQNVPLLGRPVWESVAVTHGGRTFDRLLLRYDLAAATANIAEDAVRQAAHVAVKGLVGEGSEQWLGVDGPHALRLTAANWPTARGLMELRQSARDDAAVQAIRRRLPSEASAVVLLDAAAATCQAAGLLGGVIEALPAFPGLEPPTIVRPVGRSPFLGLAVVAEPGGGRVTLVLPAEAMRAAGSCVKW